MSAVSGNKTVPDIYSWHQIGTWEREPDTTIPDFTSMRATYRLPEKPIDINEYGWSTEQNPANSVYYISQLERYNLRGLRSNWGSGSGLHDFLGSLVAKSNGKYVPNGDWQLYRYYANMTGTRLVTSASANPQFDVFAVREKAVLKIIAGTRSLQRDSSISVTGLDKLGIPGEGSVSVRSYRFDWRGAQGEVGDPVSLGSTSRTYSSGNVSLEHGQLAEFLSRHC